MKKYKVIVAGIEMILPEDALTFIQNRGWEYTELIDVEETHSISDFMGATLNEILNLNQ